MSRDPASWIGALWHRLGLGSPTGDAVEVLDVDGVSLRLRGSDTGRSVIVEADGGFLPLDPPERARAIRRLLAVNLGMLTTNVAGVSLADAGADRTVVRVTGVWPLGAGELDGLMAVIDDVIDRAEFHRRELADTATGGPRPVRPVEEEFDPRFVFRP